MTTETSGAQATPRHPTIDAWGRVHERANEAEATLRRGRSILRRWAKRDLHRDAAQLLNELLVAIETDMTSDGIVSDEEPRDTRADALLDLIQRATPTLAIGHDGLPIQTIVGWNLAMEHIRQLVGEMGAPGPRVVHFGTPPQVTAPPTPDDTDLRHAARARGQRLERAELLGLLCASLPTQDSVICQPTGADDWYLLLVHVLGEQLTFVVTEADLLYLDDVRWALLEDPAARVDPTTAEQRHDRVRRVIDTHTLVRDARPPHPAEAPDPDTLRATLHGTGVVTIHPTPTGTRSA
ncbi:hypothetical protein ACIP98_21180 [Streptomyces sp. NPDC088354]|uniref:hypothetical protein n=1 Tax=Streptomyces sp. NPDC088354 TaxID=3365856 RepID=UPI00381CBC50